MNVGLKMTAEEVAHGINLREASEPRNTFNRPRIAYRVADPKIFSWDSGPPISERMSNPPYYVGFQKADNKRTPKSGAMGGWDMLRARLKGDGITPMIFFMDCCPAIIRTLPILEHHELNLEDVNSASEDHAPDETRYACMSRPYSAPTHVEKIRKVLRMKDNTVVLHDILEEQRMVSKDRNPRIL